MDAADFYTGIVPDVYSVLRGSRFDAGHYRAFILRHGTPVLELGCGDDGPFFDLLAEGFDIDGVDSSADMVRRGRERIAADGPSAGAATGVIHHQRMEDLDLGRRYRSIYLAGPTFNLLPDDDTSLRALRAIAAHLEPSGAALVPLWVPPPTAPSEFGRVRSAKLGDGEARFTVLEEKYDVDERTRTTLSRYELVGPDTATVERDWIIHWHTPESFRALAQAAGLDTTLETIDEEQFEATLHHSAV